MGGLGGALLLSPNLVRHAVAVRTTALVLPTCSRWASASASALQIRTAFRGKRRRGPDRRTHERIVGGFVTTASLLDGKLAIYTAQLKLVHISKLGPATRNVATSNP